MWNLWWFKNKINDKNILEIGTKVSFIIKLSGLLYNNYKIIPYWTIQQIKIITLDYNIDSILKIYKKKRN